ncbi:MAG: efflux transporter outer membrane subunit [Thermodesulforhabdaceae bacterium]
MAVWKTTIKALSVGIVISFAGCFSVGPDYTRPHVPVPESWHNLKDHPAKTILSEADEKLLAEWWKTLGDPVLSNLIKRSVKGNLDVANAYARVREARARRGIAASALFPTLGMSASAKGSYTDVHKGPTTTQDYYDLGFDSSWELDIFGGTRRSVEAAQRTLEATEENLKNVLVSLTAEVALTYVELRTYQKRLAVAEENLAVQEESFRLASWRYEAGLSDELAVQQARYNLESTRSQIPLLRASIDEAMNRLAVLTGEPPGKLHNELEDYTSYNLSVPQDDLLVGIPADLLRRRPDIKKAERELAAQTARIGIAEAELYPKLSLSGSIGLEALSPGGIFASATKTIVGRGFLSFPIFSGGALVQAVEAEKALTEQALASYRSTVLQALEEVENAIKSYAEEKKRHEALISAELSARRAADLARQKYASGLVDFGTVLEAERSHLALQDQLTQSEGNIISYLIRLYKALGGGWLVSE